MMLALKNLAEVKSSGLKKCLGCRKKPSLYFRRKKSWVPDDPDEEDGPGHYMDLLVSEIGCKKGCLRHAVSSFPKLGPDDLTFNFVMYSKAADLLGKWWDKKMVAP
jgi:hypothetical protein